MQSTHHAPASNLKSDAPGDAASEAPQAARGGVDRNHARGRRRVPQSGDALFDRQGFERDAAPCASRRSIRRRLPFPLLHVDTTWKFREMIAFRDETARRLGLELIVHINQDGVDARHQSDRIRLVAAYPCDEDRGAASRRSTNMDSMPPSAARGATRRRAAPRSASFRSAPRAMPGIRATSARNCGTCSTPASGPAKRCGSFRCRIGPSWTSGTTSGWRTFRWCRSISPRSARSCSASGTWIMVDDERLPLEPGETPRDAARPLPHAGLLSR